MWVASDHFARGVDREIVLFQRIKIVGSVREYVWDLVMFRKRVGKSQRAGCGEVQDTAPASALDTLEFLAI